VEPTRKVLHHVQIYHFAKFEHFWILGRQQIWITRFEQFLNNWKALCTESDPTHCSVRPSSIFLNQPEATPGWTGPVHPASFHCTHAWASSRQHGEADCQRGVSTVPAATLTHITCLPPSTRSACSCCPRCSASSRPSSSRCRGKASLAFSSSPQQPPSARPLCFASRCPPPL
jgi:hypothetical protein